MENRTMTFEQFRATRKFVGNVEEICDGYDAEPGYVYNDALVITIANGTWGEEARNKGAFSLVLANTDFLSDDLQDLERRLYDWACGETFDAPPLDPKRFELPDSIIEDCINASCLIIQRHIGQTDGGVAGMFFSGEERDDFALVLREYAECERVHDQEDHS